MFSFSPEHRETSRITFTRLISSSSSSAQQQQQPPIIFPPPLDLLSCEEYIDPVMDDGAADSGSASVVQLIIDASRVVIAALDCIHEDEIDDVCEMARLMHRTVRATPVVLMRHSMLALAATAIYLSMHKRTRVTTLEEMKSEHRPVRVSISMVTSASGCKKADISACLAVFTPHIKPYTGMCYVLT